MTETATIETNDALPQPTTTVLAVREPPAAVRPDRGA
jgi:hypothetical protein